MLLTIASAVRGLPVVTISGGEDVAEIRDIVYDPQDGNVSGFTLNKRGIFSGRRKEVLASAQLIAIGRDAVMIDDISALLDRDEAPLEVGTADRHHDVLGSDVLTEGGVSLGVVKDVVLIVGGRGEVVGYEIEDASGTARYIPLPAQLAISGQALVVPEATRDFVHDDLVGLGACVNEFHGTLVAR